MQSLIYSIKKSNTKNKAPLFISVDEEGGRVSRMPEPLLKLPSNKAIGERNDSSYSYRIGGVLAYELKAFGFNFDFAPVMDIYSNPKNTVIGDRAFGTDAEIVTRLGIRTMKGLQDGGVIPVVKHFPGHGDTEVDSHIGLPVVEYDLKRLESFEFVPFKAAVNNGADAVMVAHILMKKIDPINPASFSKAVITGILREQMKFGGVVLTDDMTMGAVLNHFQIGEAAVRSIRAGADILLVCHGTANQQKVIEAVKAAVKSGSITQQRLDASVARILRLKNKYRLSDRKIPPASFEEVNKKIAALSTK
jgi:beta-N-acetylhexosaminidase